MNEVLRSILRLEFDGEEGRGRTGRFQTVEAVTISSFFFSDCLDSPCLCPRHRHDAGFALPRISQSSPNRLGRGPTPVVSGAGLCSTTLQPQLSWGERPISML